MSNSRSNYFKASKNNLTIQTLIRDDIICELDCQIYARTGHIAGASLFAKVYNWRLILRLCFQGASSAVKRLLCAKNCLRASIRTPPPPDDTPGVPESCTATLIARAQAT